MSIVWNQFCGCRIREDVLLHYEQQEHRSNQAEQSYEEHHRGRCPQFLPRRIDAVEEDRKSRQEKCYSSKQQSRFQYERRGFTTETRDLQNRQTQRSQSSRVGRVYYRFYEFLFKFFHNSISSTSGWLLSL